MANLESCVDVDLGEDFIPVCQQITDRAIVFWRQEGISENQIQHSVSHSFPAIWPQFATSEELILLKFASAKKLNLSPALIQIDGIRKDALINLLVNLPK